jgi:hypothetical protein
LDANENALGHSISPYDDDDDDPPLPTAPQLNGVATLEAELRPILGLDLHRYPDPSHPKIKSRIAELRGVPSPDHVFLGVGSDEVIDLLIRVCVAPGRECILITPPTYGMYAVCAQVNDVGIVRVNLELSAEGGEGGEKGRFSLRVDDVCLASLFLVSSSSIESVVMYVGEEGGRCRSVDQADFSVLARKPHWDTHLPLIRPRDTQLRAIQRDRGRRRGLH